MAILVPPPAQEPQAIANSIAKLLLLGSAAHLIALEWHQRDKYLNSGQFECSSD